MPTQDEVNAKLQQLFPDHAQRGDIRHTLVGLPASDLEMLFGDVDEAVKQALLRRLAPGPAAAEAGFVETQAWRDTLQRYSLARQTASATSVMLQVVGGDKKVK